LVTPRQHLNPALQPGGCLRVPFSTTAPGLQSQLTRVAGNLVQRCRSVVAIRGQQPAASTKPQGIGVLLHRK
jgi:hypothetical protein